MSDEQAGEVDPGNVQTDALPVATDEDDGDDDPGNHVTRGGLGSGSAQKKNG
jgi:hypothetical protein